MIVRFFRPPFEAEPREGICSEHLCPMHVGLGLVTCTGRGVNHFWQTSLNTCRYKETTLLIGSHSTWTVHWQSHLSPWNVPGL